MIKINDNVKLKHLKFFKSPEILSGIVKDIKHYEGESEDGRAYDKTFYHIKLQNGKNIVVNGKNTNPPYIKFYKLINA